MERIHLKLPPSNTVADIGNKQGPQMCAPKPNITKEEAKALEELGEDKDRAILRVDKRATLVVLDRQDYQ